MTRNIFLLSNSVSTLFLACYTLHCSASLEIGIVNLVSLVASDVTALAIFFRALVMCDYSTWG